MIGLIKQLSVKGDEIFFHFGINDRSCNHVKFSSSDYQTISSAYTLEFNTFHSYSDNFKKIIHIIVIAILTYIRLIHANII